MKACIPAALVCLASLLSVADARAAVPMFNATCPGGLDVHADAGGPVYVNGRETALKRFNEDYYEARDGASTVTLSISRAPDGTASVSYTSANGTSGTCTLADTGGRASAMAYRPDDRSDDRPDGEDGSDVTCASTDRRQTECGMDTRGEVRLVRQLSHTPCEQGVNWGLSRHSVWVKDGCRATFRNVSVDGDRHHDHHDAVGAGAAGVLLGACNVRAGDQGVLVTRVPVNDEVTELIVDYADGRYLCMVRNDGLVQSLTRLRKR